MNVRILLIGCLLWTAVVAPPSHAADPAVSEATQECLECHASFHPGIVEAWRSSRHAAVTPSTAMAVEGLARKVSADTVPEGSRDVVVGCAECHLQRPEAHADTFDHNGYEVHVVVSPDDCKSCHPVERDQYSRNVMAHAHQNLAGNAVYNQLQRAILGSPVVTDGKLTLEAENADTQAEACYYCHGTALKVKGTEVRDTDAGELAFPVIEGWPNQGVGRVNLDGSLGSCAACHTRHGFSIEMARKPHTCRECHVGPDVPAYKVYAASKHGNLYAAHNDEWDFQAVPWTIGKDFKAPTCAVCHVSLLVDTDDIVVAERTHEMKNRLSWRIFGLPYAHPQPIDPDTTVIRNKDGLPLPTDLGGGFAEGFLISPEIQAERNAAMQAACLKCHDSSWVGGHFRRYRNAIEETNRSIRAATALVQAAWKEGLAKGIPQGENPFDEAFERAWCDAWLFYANNTRFASAMAGGGDFGVFADGRYHLSSAVFELKHRLDAARNIQPLKPVD